MSLQENQDNSSTYPVKCEWTDEQEETMVEMLDISQSNTDCRNGFVRAIWKSIAIALKGTEGLSKVKTGDMCNSHWKVLSRRYKDAKQLQEIGASWNEESSMIELPMNRWEEMASMPTITNKRLGWFRRRQFPLYNAVGAVVDRGMIKDGDQLENFAPFNRLQTADIDQLESSFSEDSNSHSSDESDQELQQAKLESDSAHAFSTSTIADPPISSSKVIHKRKLTQGKSVSLEDLRARSTSNVSTMRSSESTRKKSRESTTELFIDSMESIQDKFLVQMKADLASSSSRNMKRPLDYMVIAVDVLQKMKNLETEFLFKALDLFKDQPVYAKIFVCLQKEELRIKWLKYKLESVW
ncbi:hypothetical protein DFH28DRAFT_888326 [Melampsora americana]|nr:hypothetical protein DFH28DRAFT_888326 [Melampsora americana]